MNRHCVICGSKEKLTQHHYHWPKNYIFKHYPKTYNFMRTLLQWVCMDCHVEYNNTYLHECHRMGCQECKFTTICRYDTAKEVS